MLVSYELVFNDFKNGVTNNITWIQLSVHFNHYKNTLSKKKKKRLIILNYIFNNLSTY